MPDARPTDRLSIGDVAAELGLSLRTIRYYEEVGLVTPGRTEGGHRVYGGVEVARLRLIMSTRALGLSLEEMGRLLDLVAAGGEPGRLADGDLAAVVAGLREYAERSDAAIARHEQDLRRARELRLRIGEQLARCEMLLEHRRG